MKETQSNEKFAYYSIIGGVNELSEKSNRNIHALVRGIQTLSAIPCLSVDMGNFHRLKKCYHHTSCMVKKKNYCHLKNKRLVKVFFNCDIIG